MKSKWLLYQQREKTKQKGVEVVSREYVSAKSQTTILNYLQQDKESGSSRTVYNTVKCDPGITIESLAVK